MKKQNDTAENAQPETLSDADLEKAAGGWSGGYSGGARARRNLVYGIRGFFGIPKHGYKIVRR
jgi:hypothetical protein